MRKAQEKRAEEQRKAKETDAALAADVRKAEAVAREVVRKDTNKRRYHVGALADEAGLFQWSNADFQAVFAVLARLEVPNPGGLLEGVLSENGVALSPVYEFSQRNSISRQLVRAWKRHGDGADSGGCSEWHERKIRILLKDF